MPDQPIAIAIQSTNHSNNNNNNNHGSDNLSDTGIRHRPLIAVACKRGGAVYKLQPNTS